MLHLHGHNVYFNMLASLPFHILNWHDRETTPSLADALKTSEVLKTSDVPRQFAVCGGLRQDTLVYRDRAEVRAEAEDAIHQTNGKRFILSTGCVVPVIAPHGNLTAAKRVVGASNSIDETG